MIQNDIHFLSCFLHLELIHNLFNCWRLVLGLSHIISDYFEDFLFFFRLRSLTCGHAQHFIDFFFFFANLNFLDTLDNVLIFLFLPPLLFILSMGPFSLIAWLGKLNIKSIFLEGLLELLVKGIFWTFQAERHQSECLHAVPQLNQWGLTQLCMCCAQTDQSFIRTDCYWQHFCMLRLSLVEISLSQHCPQARQQGHWIICQNWPHISLTIVYVLLQETLAENIIFVLWPVNIALFICLIVLIIIVFSWLNNEIIIFIKLGTPFIDNWCQSMVLTHSFSNSFIFICILLVKNNENKIESTQKWVRHSNILGWSFVFLILSKNRISSRNNWTPCIEWTVNTCLSNSYSLLFHDFVHSNSIIFVHFIELINADNSSVSEDHGTSF